MIFVSDFFKTVQIIVNPSRYTKMQTSAKGALFLYYASLVMSIAIKMLVYILIVSTKYQIDFVGLFFNDVLASAAILPIIYVLFAAALQLGSRLFKYSLQPDKTFVAVFMGGAAQAVLLGLLQTFFRILSVWGIDYPENLGYFPVIWGFIVLIFALSNQHKINKSRAISLSLLGLFLLFVLIFIIGAFVTFSRHL